MLEPRSRVALDLTALQGSFKHATPVLTHARGEESKSPCSPFFSQMLIVLRPKDLLLRIHSLPVWRYNDTGS